MGSIHRKMTATTIRGILTRHLEDDWASNKHCGGIMRNSTKHRDSTVIDNQKWVWFRIRNPKEWMANMAWPD
jgi:hypothetical protein